MHKYETDDTEIPNATSLKEKGDLYAKDICVCLCIRAWMACENTGVPIHIHLNCLYEQSSHKNYVQKVLR